MNFPNRPSALLLQHYICLDVLSFDIAAPEHRKGRSAENTRLSAAAVLCSATNVSGSTSDKGVMRYKAANTD
jgi:hypothetical protein